MGLEFFEAIDCSGVNSCEKPPSHGERRRTADNDYEMNRRVTIGVASTERFLVL